MGINLGAIEISDIKLGDTQVEKIYLGSTETWSGGGSELTDYGRLFYYPFSSEYAVQGGTTRCTVNSIDQTVFASFAEAHPSSSWTFQYTTSTGVWKCQTVSIAPEDMLATTGVDVTITGSGTARFVIRFSQNIDTSATPIEVTLANSTEYAALNTSSGDPTIGGLQIPKAAIQGYEFGSVPTTTPDYFLASCSNLASLTGLESSSLEYLGDYFLSSTTSFNHALVFPASLSHPGNYFLSSSHFDSQLTLTGITNVGTGFLQNSTFNKTLSIPNSVTTIGTNFMYGCTAYNQPLTIPNSVTTIGTNFMYGCTAYNSTLTLSGSVTALSDYFLYNCTAYNQPLTIPNSVTTIGTDFMYGCTIFNSALSLSNQLTGIGTRFLAQCSAFNQTITLPNTLTTIGAQFLFRCTAFNQPLTIPGSVSTTPGPLLGYCTSFNSTITLESGVTTIGSQFLYDCTAFNQAISLPSTVTTISDSFLYGCEAFNQPVDFLGSVATIGAQFLGWCFGFNNTVTLPSTLSSLGYGLLYDHKSSQNPNITVVCNAPTTILDTTSAQVINSTLSTSRVTYDNLNPITLTGTYAADWNAIFPDKTSSPYRKTVVAS